MSDADTYEAIYYGAHDSGVCPLCHLEYDDPDECNGIWHCLYCCRSFDVQETTSGFTRHIQWHEKRGDPLFVEIQE